MNVVITGSSRGIGLGLAEEFIKAGHGVLLNSRDRIKCGETAALLRSKYPDALIHIYACDVTIYNSVERMFWEANRFFGSVDIWINNAGISQDYLLLCNQDKNNIDTVLDINIKGTIYGTKIAMEGMKHSGGYIYNMEGFGSNNMMSEKMSIYGTSKRAITYFTKSMAKEMKNSKIKIGLLSPGMVRTDLLRTTMSEKSKIYNILADDIEKVTPFLVKKILNNNKNGISIKWLTNRKAFFRFLLSPFKTGKQ